MSDFHDVLQYVAYMDIGTHVLSKMGDVVTITVALLLLLATNTGFSVYLLVMRSDEANKARLLNVLYANLAVCLMLDSFLIFGQYLGAVHKLRNDN